MSNDPTVLSPSPVTALVTNRREVAIGLAVAAAVLAALAIWWGIWGFARSGGAATTTEGKLVPDQPAETKVEDDRPKKSADYQIAAIWAAGMALLALASAGWLYAHPADPTAPLSAARAEIVAFGGLAGLLTTLCGAALGYRWRMSLELWVSSGDRSEAKWVLYAAAVFVAGLIIMFVSLQVARTEQRANAILRRLLYGFNSVFVGLLLLLVLVAVNVFSFMRIPATLATNDTAFIALSDESKRFLEELDRPVQVYLIMPENYAEEIAGRPYTSLYADCRGLLSQCEDQSRRFHAVYLSPAFDKDRIAGIYDRLNVPKAERDRYGMLVTIGEDEGVHALIPAVELIDFEGRQLVFQGENRLMTELLYLTDTRGKEKVYFTTGHRELSIEPTGEGPSAANLVRYLRDCKVNVETVRLVPTEAQIPDDAGVLVIAGPREPFEPTSADAIREFVNRPNKPGKVLAFLPAIPDVNNKVQGSGLEGLLRDFGVDADPNHRLVTVPNLFKTRDAAGREIAMPPTYAYVGPYQVQVESLDRALGGGRLLLENTRPMRPGPPGGAYRATPLMGTFGLVWLEESFNTDPARTFAQLRQDKDGTFAAEKRVSERPVPVAVAVTQPPAPGGKGDPQPRMVVFGSDTLLLDRPAIEAGREEYRQQLVTDLLDWLKGRSASIGIKPRKVGIFALEKPIDWPSQLVLLVMVTGGITALGVGVWLSRRK